MTKTVIAGALGECVHVAGVSNFLRLAEMAGWWTIFLGPAAPIQAFLDAARRETPNLQPGEELLIGVSYCLTSETSKRLLGAFAEEASELHEGGVRFAFGGTPGRRAGCQPERFDGCATALQQSFRPGKSAHANCGWRQYGG